MRRNLLHRNMEFIIIHNFGAYILDSESFKHITPHSSMNIVAIYFIHASTFASRKIDISYIIIICYRIFKARYSKCNKNLNATKRHLKFRHIRDWHTHCYKNCVLEIWDISTFSLFNSYSRNVCKSLGRWNLK